MTGPGDTPTDLVTLTIDDTDIAVPKGTLVIRAAEMIGIRIPRFCDHPLLEPVGACRQCLVDVEGQRKPLASCTTIATDGMIVRTQHTSPVADKAQQGVMELLLINHPLDCPVCDKGGECPLQNQAMTNGRSRTRFDDVKRTYPKPIPISSQVLLDRERCVLCARCTRVADQIAGDRFIDMLERGALQQVGLYAEKPFDSYFSGNTVQVCPVGALTGTAYRFRARPFDLVSTESVCEHCADGCAQRTDHRRGTVLRRLAGDDPEVNEEWNCDKGRWAFTYATEPDRITTPLIRDTTGTLTPASWPAALAAAARGLGAAHGRAGVLTGGRLTREDAYAYAKFARVALGSDDIDFRVRAHSDEETGFLADHVAGTATRVTYTDLAAAPVVLLVGLEPEEESPIVFLRLRKAVRTHTLAVYSIAPYAGPGLHKLSATLIPARPGTEAAVLGDPDLIPGELLRAPGAIILVGERAAATPGTLSAAVELAETTGARLAWIPRRAGDRGALDAGALSGLLPGGRRLTDTDHRRDVAARWGVDADTLPVEPGRTTSGILEAAARGDLGVLLVAGVDLTDLPDPHAARAALDAANFVVSIELRHSDVTARADVVFPIAPVAEKAGSFTNWEGRVREFPAALTDTGALPDTRVVDALASAMGIRLGLNDIHAARAELDAFGPLSESPSGTRRHVTAPPDAAPGRGEAVLATWRMLLDAGRLQDGEPYLAGTARAPVARLSAATAAEVGVRDGDPVVLATDHGELTLPVCIDTLPDRVVWAPTNAPGCSVHEHLAADTGALVRLRPADTLEGRTV